MKKFKTGIPGYKKEEVNIFVNDVIKQVEAMIDDLKRKDNEISELKNSLEHYKNMENTFNRAILVAEDASNQIKRIARDESASIIDEAKKNASRIVNDALIQAERTQNETIQLKRNVVTFKRRLRTIIESQLDLVDDIEHLDL
ncbi:MAG: DivIVA domain-containing protein [Bacilli bacterium]|nr:DivIVA domain-containing protein [Bacilli bacterium]MDD4408003.1 DivIVA domain-containing protein [Bacilli bacterium]